MESLKEMILVQGERQQELLVKRETADSPLPDGDSVRVDEINSPRLSILCLPARSQADEIAAMMLAQVLEASGCSAQAISVTALAGEMIDLVDQCTAADVICISATPPAAVMHARYLSKRLRGWLPVAKLIVGLWDAQGDLHKTGERIGCDAIVVATLAAAQEQIRTLIQPGVPRSHAQTPLQHGPSVIAGTNQ
jgi:hypothetical protein